MEKIKKTPFYVKQCTHPNEIVPHLEYATISSKQFFIIQLSFTNQTKHFFSFTDQTKCSFEHLAPVAANSSQELCVGSWVERKAMGEI